MVRIPSDEPAWHAPSPEAYGTDRDRVLRHWDSLKELTDDEFAFLLSGPEDPLGISELCYDGMVAEGFLLDHRTLIDRLAGWVTTARPAIGSAEEACDVLPELLQAAMRRQVDHEEELAAAGDPLPEPLPRCLNALSVNLGIPEPLTRKAAVALNTMTWSLRHPVLITILMAKGYDAYHRQYGIPEDVTRERMLEAINRLRDILTGGTGKRRP